MTFAQIFDIGAALALAFFMVRGGMRGLTGEIISLLGLITSLVCGWKFAKPMGALILRYFPSFSPAITELACAAVIFIAVSLIFAVLGKIMKAIVKAAKLSFLDHAFGAVSGSARAFAIVLCIYGVVSVFPAIPSRWMRDSVAMQGAAAVWPPVYEMMTDRGWINTNPIAPSAPAFVPDYLNPSSSDA